MKGKYWIIIAVVVLAIMTVIIWRNTNSTITQKAFGFDINVQNPETCDTLSDIAAKDTCYNTVAINIKGPSLCEKISNNKQKDICLSGVTYKLENRVFYEHEGTIVHNIEDNKDFLGLKLNFWSKPFGQRKLRINNLSEEFRIENLKVTVKYEITDVIGTSDWDVVIKISDIQKI